MHLNRTPDRSSPFYYPRRAILAFLLLTFLLALASNATAVPALPFAVDANATLSIETTDCCAICPTCFFQEFNNITSHIGPGPQQTTTAGPGRVISPTGAGSVTGSAVGTARLGDLSGSVTITADSKSLRVGGANGATASAQFVDTATVVPTNPLPLGSPVQLLLRATVNAAIASSPTSLLGGTVNVPTGFQFGLTSGLVPIGTFPFPQEVSCIAQPSACLNHLILSATPIDATFHETASAILNETVGTPFTFGGVLRLDAEVSETPGAATVTVDPMFTLDVLTPGASYITASGLAYETTPEPTTLLLFGTTAVGLGLARRKRHRQQ